MMIKKEVNFFLAFLWDFEKWQRIVEKRNGWVLKINVSFEKFVVRNRHACSLRSIKFKRLILFDKEIRIFILKKEKNFRLHIRMEW